MKQTSAGHIDGLVSEIRGKRDTRALLESIARGDEVSDLKLAPKIARTLFYKGLVRPVKPSDAWFPCVLTEVGAAVVAKLKVLP